MSHRRKEIKEKAIQYLRKLPELDGLRVFRHRSEDIWETDLPVAIVKISKEISRKFGEAPRILERRAYLSVEIFIQGEDLDERLDGVANRVEDEFFNDLTMDCLISDLVLVETTREDSAEGIKPSGSVALVFEALYYTDESGDLETRPLEKIATEFSL